MEVQIKIKIKPQDHNDFSESELISDLRWQFADITGYEIYNIEVKEL